MASLSVDIEQAVYDSQSSDSDTEIRPMTDKPGASVQPILNKKASPLEQLKELQNEDEK